MRLRTGRRWGTVDNEEAHTGQQARDVVMPEITSLAAPVDVSDCFPGSSGQAGAACNAEAADRSELKAGWLS